MEKAEQRSKHMFKSICEGKMCAYAKMHVCKDTLQFPRSEATGCASATDHLVPHDIIQVPPKT